MTTSRIVIPRGRVSMNITTFATSLASSRLPDSLASEEVDHPGKATALLRRWQPD
jgi:hypothetical protein